MRLGSCGVLAALNHPGGQRLEVFWVVTEEGVQVASSRRGRDAAGHPLMHRTGPPTPLDSRMDSRVGSVEGRRPCLRRTGSRAFKSL